MDKVLGVDVPAAVVALLRRGIPEVVPPGPDTRELRAIALAALSGVDPVRCGDRDRCPADALAIVLAELREQAEATTRAVIAVPPGPPHDLLARAAQAAGLLLIDVIDPALAAVLARRYVDEPPEDERVVLVLADALDGVRAAVVVVEDETPVLRADGSGDSLEGALDGVGHDDVDAVLVLGGIDVGERFAGRLIDAPDHATLIARGAAVHGALAAELACPSCGSTQPASAARCGACGSPLSAPSTVACAECGTYRPEQMPCHVCAAGTERSSERTVRPEPREAAAVAEAVGHTDLVAADAVPPDVADVALASEDTGGPLSVALPDGPVVPVATPAVLGAAPLPEVGPAPPPARPKRRRLAVLAIGPLIVAALLIVGLTTWWSGSSVVLLQAVGPPGGGAFTPDFALDADRVRGNAVVSSLPDGVHPGDVVTGGTETLYASVQNRSACDRAGVVAFFRSRPEVSRTWERAAGVGSDAAAYLADLTPLLLRADVLVTAHTLDGDDAEPMQAVLQAGTAILVDAAGVPRLRCATGAPLGAPEARLQNAKTVGDPWPGFDPGAVITISGSGTVAEWGLVDPAGHAFRRPAGTDGAADFDPVPSTAALLGTYSLQGSATTCDNFSDCSDYRTIFLTVTVDGCTRSGCRMTSPSGMWDSSVFLERSGSRWSASGSLAPGTYNCGGSDVSSSLDLTLVPSKGGVVGSRWTATAVTGTLRHDIPRGECSQGLLIWQLTGGR